MINQLYTFSNDDEQIEAMPEMPEKFLAERNDFQRDFDSEDCKNTSTEPRQYGEKGLDGMCFLKPGNVF